jgi:hypothetical protein
VFFPWPTNSSGGCAYGTVCSSIKSAAQDPNLGGSYFGRGQGWQGQSTIAGLETTTNAEILNIGRRWMTDYIDVLSATQISQTGNFLKQNPSGKFKATYDLNENGVIECNPSAGITAECDIMPYSTAPWEVGIFHFGFGRGLVAELDPVLDASYVASLTSTLQATSQYFVNQAWDPTANAPIFKHATAHPNDPANLYVTLTSGMAQGTAGFYFSDVLAYAYELSGDPTYLNTYLAAINGGSLANLDTSGGNTTLAAWVVQQLASPSASVASVDLIRHPDMAFERPPVPDSPSRPGAESADHLSDFVTDRVPPYQAGSTFKLRPSEVDMLVSEIDDLYEELDQFSKPPLRSSTPL